MMNCCITLAGKGGPMSTALSRTQSDSAGLLATSVKATTLRPADLGKDLLPSKRSSITTRAFAHFLITFCIAVGVTACTAVRATKPVSSQAPPARNVSSQENPMGPLHGISF
jgi:hypothetical protein